MAAVAEGLPALLDHGRLPLSLGAERELARHDGRAGGEVVGDAHGRILPIRPERPGRRLRTRLAQDDEVLHRVAKRAARHVLDELPTVRGAIAHERGWVEGRAEVRACDLCPAYDALTVCVDAALLAPQLLDVRVAAERQQQVAAGTQHAAELIAPGKLRVATGRWVSTESA